eukprot:1139207-Pelagomonas_calceolata.AAC.2
MWMLWHGKVHLLFWRSLRQASQRSGRGSDGLCDPQFARASQALSKTTQQAAQIQPGMRLNWVKKRPAL